MQVLAYTSQWGMILPALTEMNVYVMNSSQDTKNRFYFKTFTLYMHLTANLYPARNNLICRIVKNAVHQMCRPRRWVRDVAIHALNTCVSSRFPLQYSGEDMSSNKLHHQRRSGRLRSHCVSCSILVSDTGINQ